MVIGCGNEGRFLVNGETVCRHCMIRIVEESSGVICSVARERSPCQHKRPATEAEEKLLFRGAR